MRPDEEIDAKREAELTADFLNTRFGEHVIYKLSVMYNAQHHKAEEADSVDAKALAVERAAGIRVAIDMLTKPATLVEVDYFKEAKE